MDKDNALKMAIEALPELISTAQAEYDSQAKTYEGYPNMAYRYSYLKDIADDGTKALDACKQALEQQEIGDAEIRQMLNDIEYYQKRVEELEKTALPLSDVLDLIPNTEAKEFWKGVYENGITAKELANELSDMHIMIENVPKIVYAVTGGLLSKATYEAQTVISKFNDYVDDVVKEAIEDYKEENEIEPLSDEEIREVIIKEGIPVRTGNTAVRFARAIEAKLRENNNG